MDTGINDFETYRTDNVSDKLDNGITERKLSYADKSEYFGTTLKGQRHGKGVFRSENGLIYDGEWKYDQYCGLGKLVEEDGTVYIGSFLNGKKEGIGRQQCGLGKYTYEGEFKENERQGKGREIYPDNSWYEGNFHNGKKNGKGKYNLADGSLYEGQFLNGNINGVVRINIKKGTYKWTDGKSYTGEWKDNSLHGFGVLIKPGKKYQGYFANDKKNGLGIYTVGDEKKRLVGKFIDNEMEGLALQFNGNIIEKYMMMEKNKPRKVLNKEEIDKVKKSEEYMNLVIFVDEASLRSSTQLL